MFVLGFVCGGAFAFITLIIIRHVAVYLVAARRLPAGMRRCLLCGVAFLIPPHDDPKHPTRFCSHVCAEQYYRRIRGD